MKTKGRHKDKVNVITLGCSKNLVDSEVLINQLAGGGIDAVHESPDDHANIIIINTCGFIEKAKQESIDTILRFANARKKGGIEKLYVTGCLSERYKKELQAEIPEVDAYFGTHDLPFLLKKFKVDYRKDLIGERKFPGQRHYAYMKISEGCDRPCSFCAIPLIRGKHVSRPIEDLVSEAGSLASQGVKELILIAQDTTYYGMDLYRERKLGALLSALLGINDIEWIRLHYAFPSGFPMEVIDIMAGNPRICRYLDIPLQHGSDRMLKIMRRGITADKTEQLITELRDKVPGISIRTTMIVGHPGETEEDFDILTDFVQRMKFDRLGVFGYSHEEGTHAYGMQDDIPESVKQKRLEKLMEIQENISLKRNQMKIGSRLKVLIDRREGDHFVGRTEFDSPEIDNEIIIDAGRQNYVPGEFIHVEIADAMAFDLIGKPV